MRLCLPGLKYVKQERGIISSGFQLQLLLTDRERPWANPLIFLSLNDLICKTGRLVPLLNCCG